MAHVLRQLDAQRDPRLIVGTETFDDAGVYALSDETALVQTVDFFPPLVDDPFTFGQIAAANALSDVYAMGGEPLTALNIVCFPDNELPPEVLVEILRGGASKVREAGAVVAGGHSVRDREVKYGLAVTGRVDPRRIWTNAAARPGDVLVLTKPLGSGVLTSAVKSGKLDERELAEAVAVMTELNRVGRDAALSAGVDVHACTDVTGFGLVGHAFEMAQGGRVSIVLDAGEVPLMTHVLELARAGVLTRAHKSTREFVGQRLRVDPTIEPALAGVLLDAQTSGGLLLSVSPDQADKLRGALRNAGAACAAVVGRVQPGDEFGVRITG
jgi:selenide,water dikinase